MCRHLLNPLNPSYGQRWDEADDDGLRSRLTGFKQSNRINETGSNFNSSTSISSKLTVQRSSLRVPYKLWQHLWRWPCASMGPLQTTKTWDQSTKTMAANSWPGANHCNTWLICFFQVKLLVGIEKESLRSCSVLGTSRVSSQVPRGEGFVPKIHSSPDNSTNI